MRSELDMGDFWFHHLENNYFLGVTFTIEGSRSKYRAPEVWAIYENLDESTSVGRRNWEYILDFYHETFYPPRKGYVIRAENLHSNQGAFIFPERPGGKELLRGIPMSPKQVKQLIQSQNVVTHIVIQEYISPMEEFTEETAQLPNEYKAHVFN